MNQEKEKGTIFNITKKYLKRLLKRLDSSEYVSDHDIGLGYILIEIFETKSGEQMGHAKIHLHRKGKTPNDLSKGELEIISLKTGLECHVKKLYESGHYNELIKSLIKKASVEGK